MLAVELQGLEYLAAGVLVGGDGHDEGVKQEVAVIEAGFLGVIDDIGNRFQALGGRLGYAVFGDRQAEDGGTVLLGERQEVADAVVFCGDGVDEGAARIGAQAGFECGRIARVDGERGVGELGNLGHGLAHGLDGVDAGHAHVDVEQLSAGLDLIDGLFLDGEQGAFAYFGGELLAARRVDALAYEDGRQVLVDADGLAAAGEPEALWQRTALGLRLTFECLAQCADVLRRRATAAAEVRGAGGEELRAPAAEVLWAHREVRLAVDELRHAGIRLDADGAVAVFGERLDDGHELLWSERAVDADDIGAHVGEDDGGRLRIGARDCAAVVAVGQLADDRDPGCDILGGEQRGAHLLDVDARLDDEVVDAGFCEGGSLLEEAGVGVFEIEVAERADEAPRRPHGAGDLGARAGRFLGNPDGRHIELCHAVFEAVVVELEAARAEGVRLDDGRAGLDVRLVDVPDDFWVVDVHEFGAAARFQAAGLQHRAHGTVKDMDHSQFLQSCS